MKWRKIKSLLFLFISSSSQRAFRTILIESWAHQWNHKTVIERIWDGKWELINSREDLWVDRTAKGLMLQWCWAFSKESTPRVGHQPLCVWCLWFCKMGDYPVIEGMNLMGFRKVLSDLILWDTDLFTLQMTGEFLTVQKSGNLAVVWTAFWGVCGWKRHQTKVVWGFFFILCVPAGLNAELRNASCLISQSHTINLLPSVS